jgi:hypothetical protein
MVGQKLHEELEPALLARLEQDGFGLECKQGKLPLPADAWQALEPERGRDAVLPCRQAVEVEAVRAEAGRARSRADDERGELPVDRLILA